MSEEWNKSMEEMTNNEAIKELKTRYLVMSQCLDKEELHKANEALDMAIEALEQQPKTGHWINGNPICPCCGEDKFKDLDADIWADWQPKYCPNCGSYNGGDNNGDE